MTPSGGPAAVELVADRAFAATPGNGIVAGRVRALVADAAQLVRPKIAVMVLATVTAAFWLTAGSPAEAGRFVALLVGKIGRAHV